ncbi:MAG: hypothetical protein IPM99_22985 [Rubrivivax sp.]|nr:hypothetical protein [Rubrivivax sp.]
MADGADTHRHRGTRATQRLVEYAPSTGGLALWVHHRDGADAGEQMPAVATDGHTIFYAPAFASLPLPLQTGLVAHEVLHVALRHAQRLAELRQQLGDVDARLFNTCADAIVNSALGHLAWLELPAGSVRLEALLAQTLGGSFDATAALLDWDVERLYRAIDDRAPPDPQGGRSDGPRAARTRAIDPQGMADLLPVPQPQADPEQQAEQARTWGERLQRAHAGDGVFSLLRTLVADLPRTRTPWEQVLRTQLARSLSRRLDVSWSRPARSYLANQGRTHGGRRLPFEPGRLPAKALPRLVVVVDVSGSIADALLQRFAREIDAITRRLEAGVTLVIGDDRVQRVEQHEPGRSSLADIAFQGGGGTDFTPLLEEAGRHDPDLIVVLTDLQGPARQRPRAPVLWAVPEAHAAALQPFGRKLVLG